MSTVRHRSFTLRPAEARRPVPTAARRWPPSTLTWISSMALCLALLVSQIAQAQSAALGVTESTVNGLRVLVKPRPSSQTVAAGLFIRGGSRNITAASAGIEALMLDLATEASTNFPRETLRRELARTASALSYGSNYDYSAFT